MALGSLDGSRVRLRPIGASDYDFLFWLCSNDGTGWRWRYRVVPPRPDLFVGELWRDVLVQFVVEDRVKREPLGLVVAYNADARSRYCWVGVVLAPAAHGTGAAESLLLLADYLFTNFDLRKLYGEIPEFNLPAFHSTVGTWLTTEGVLREHELLDGRYWDLHFVSITRDTWSKFRRQLSGDDGLRDEWRPCETFSTFEDSLRLDLR